MLAKGMASHPRAGALLAMPVTVVASSICLVSGLFRFTMSNESRCAIRCAMSTRARDVQIAAAN